MTKREFAQRMVIALAGSGISFTYENLTQTADEIADHFEENSKYGQFDEECSQDINPSIAAGLAAIGEEIKELRTKN